MVQSKSITIETDDDLWLDIRENVKGMLTNNDRERSLNPITVRDMSWSCPQGKQFDVISLC